MQWLVCKVPPMLNVMKKNLLFLLLFLAASISSYGQYVRKGDIAPDFRAMSDDGTEFHLKSTLDQGKYVLLNFSAVSCTYCYVLYPELIKIGRKYPDNLQIVVMYGGYNDHVDTPQLWHQQAQFLYKEHYQKVVDNKLFSVWNTQFLNDVYSNPSKHGWPNLFLISPQGKVVEKSFGSKPEKLNKMIDKHLAAE